MPLLHLEQYFVVAKFCRIFTCCFSVVMYHTCGQLCCVEHVCDLNGTLKWNAQHKDLTEWKNYVQQEILERTISDEHWTQMAMRNLRWFQKNVMVVKERYLRWSWRTLPLRWSWKKLPFDAHEMNIASGCPQVRHLVRWYLPRLHSLSPRTPMLCVGRLRQCTPAHEQPWHLGSDSSGLVTGDVDSGLPV